MPNIFTDWEAFESWFDFSGLEDEEGTQEFIGDTMKQDLVKKMHLILQPLLLRRIKSDVAAYLPKKREYVLFAPMTKEQTDLYNVFTNKNVDPRTYIENKAINQITNAAVSQKMSRVSWRSSSTASKKKIQENSKERKRELFELPLRESPRKAKRKEEDAEAAENAFTRMMGKRGRARLPADGSTNLVPIATPVRSGSKRKSPPTSVKSESKSTRTSRQSTPATSRSRTRKSRTYKEADSDEEELSDDQFEAKLAAELAEDDKEVKLEDDNLSEQDMELAKTLELASKYQHHVQVPNTLY